MKKLALCLLIPAFLTGCVGPRMTIVTGTTIGLHCTPGNGNTTPPQISLAYKRTELAVIPTSCNGANTGTNDAFSSLAGLDFRSGFFFEPTTIHQFISTGFAARALLENPGFTNQFGKK